MTILKFSEHDRKPRYAGKTYPMAKCHCEILQPVCYPQGLLPLGHPGVILLNGEIYYLHALANLEGEGFLLEGYRFEKRDGEPRDVHLSPRGAECDCPDFLFRRRADGQCKHLRCLAELRRDGKLL